MTDSVNAYCQAISHTLTIDFMALIGLLYHPTLFVREPRGLFRTDGCRAPSRATWFVMRREAKRNDDETQQLAWLQAQEGEIAEAITLTQDFAELVRQRQPGQLETWLERATASGLQAFKSFAHGLRADYEAVKAGVTLSWSTGPVEGQINRLKMLKRQMYGRAGIGLLRQRVLCPT